MAIGLITGAPTPQPAVSEGMYLCLGLTPSATAALVHLQLLHEHYREKTSHTDHCWKQRSRSQQLAGKLQKIKLLITALAIRQGKHMPLEGHC